MNISPSSSSTVPNKGPSSHHEFFAKLYGSFEDKKVTENKMFENKMAENNNDDEDICVDDDDSDSDNSFEQKSEQGNLFEDKSRNDISPRLDVSHRHNLNLTSSQMVEHPTSGNHKLYIVGCRSVLKLGGLVFTCRHCQGVMKPCSTPCILS